MKTSAGPTRDEAGAPAALRGLDYSPDDVASAILEGVPLIMRAIRARMREGRPAGISVAQFRALLYLRRRPGSGLSEIADQLGTSVPAASELVSRLVRENLVQRELDPLERRRIRLTLSPAGAAQLDRAQEAAASWVRAMVGDLDAARRRAIGEAIVDLLQLVVASGLPSDAAAEPDRRTEGG